MELLEIVLKITSGSEYYQSPDYTKASSFEQLPIIDKNIVIKNYDKIFCSCSSIIYTQTSGSNGAPMTIPWNYNEYLKSLTTLWRLRNKYDITPRDFQLTCHANIDIHGKRIENPIIVSPNSLSLSKLYYSGSVMEDYENAIRTFKPKWMYAQPSFANYIGIYLKTNAPDLLEKITYVELVGELLTPGTEAYIKRLYTNAQVVNMYGMQEFNGIMYEVDGLMQVISENVFVELINDLGQHCKKDEEGEIVVTGLKNSTFPLIRYKTGDRAKRILLDGTEGYIITSGRANDEFIYEGNHYDGSLFFTVINEYNRIHEIKISRFQVIYRNSELLFKISSFGKLPSKDYLESELSEILRRIINLSISIKVCIVDNHSDYISGDNKIKYFISEL